VRVRWLRKALANLQAAEAYIAQDNPRAARAMARKIVDAVYTLADNPKLDISRAGRVPGTRELVVDRTHIVAYRIRHAEFQVLRVLHARQRWPERLP